MGVEVEVEDDVEEECVEESTREGIDDEEAGLLRPFRWLPIIYNVAGPRNHDKYKEKYKAPIGSCEQLLKHWDPRKLSFLLSCELFILSLSRKAAFF
jgi:hypothetical protein